MLQPPATLGADGQEFWADTVLRLTEVGLVDRVDRPLLEAAAIQFERMRQAARKIQDDGWDWRTAKSERDAALALLRIGEGFAMTASARTRLGAQELHRRSVEREMQDALGPVELVEVDDD